LSTQLVWYADLAADLSVRTGHAKNIFISPPLARAWVGGAELALVGWSGAVWALVLERGSVAGGALVWATTVVVVLSIGVAAAVPPCGPAWVGGGNGFGGRVGAGVDPRIGAGLGNGTGERAGFKVGTGVGWNVGTGVGFRVGPSVRCSVGTGVSFSVGTGVGWGVVKGDGCSVGTGVGCSVGAGVGSNVGIDVGLASRFFFSRAIEAASTLFHFNSYDLVRGST